VPRIGQQPLRVARAQEIERGDPLQRHEGGGGERGPALGRISAASVHTREAELFYWITITFSQTLGTALGDWVADGSLGYLGAAGIFGGALALVAVAHYTTRISKPLLFWSALILTRPLGAVVGDFLDKPVANGGLELSRLAASAVLAAAIVLLVTLLPQRPETVTQQERLES